MSTPVPTPAERLLALERDGESRRLAQREFVRPLALEAGAGTGKTTTLVARVLAWCLGAGWERARRRSAEVRARFGAPAPEAERIAAVVLGGVVAITFTEAAAAEMASRIGQELGAIARGGGWPKWLEEPPVEASSEPAPEARRIYGQRARALSAALDHLTVRTIHAWCLGLLADHPLEARLHPRLRVDADGRLLEEIVRETVEVRISSAYGTPPDEDFLALAERGVGPAEIVDALTTLVAAGLPAGGLAADPLGTGPLAGLLDRLRAAAAELEEGVAPALAAAGGRLDKAREVATFLAALSSSAASTTADLDGFSALLEEIRGTAPAVMGRLRDWYRGKLSQAEARAFAGIEAEVAAASGELFGLLSHVSSLDLQLLACGRRALAPLLDEVRGQLRRRGVVTFQDLLDETAALLARRQEVAARVRSRIDQLLVDEFQDTDRQQCEILRRIAFEGPVEERPGLFLVGDPKQSIYGWRSADLAAYEGFLAEVRAAGGAVRPLVQNFRSVPAVLAEVTRVVGPVMQPAPGLQPRFEALVSTDELAGAPGFRDAEHAPVEHWISWRRPAEGEADGGRSRERTRKADADAVEAEAIARDLRRLHDGHGVAWPEMALLFRATTQLETYLAALRRAEVPFVVRGDKQYYRRREVIEAAALVRSVLDPGDHLALLTLLRSSMVGVPDAALIPLWRRGLPRRVTELGGDGDVRRQLDELEPLVRTAAGELPAAVPGLDRLAGWEVSLLAALEHLARAREAFHREPGDLFVAKLRRLFLPEPVEAARYLGSYRLANLERFFRDLAAALAAGEGDVASILRLLRRSVAEALEAPEGQPQQGSEDAVRVLTIHGAKGLEFGHVYLPQLHRESRRGSAPATVAARRADGFELRLFGAPSLGFDRVAAERERVESAERVRLLYVAMTRAKQRLVLAGCWPARLEAKGAEAASSLLDLLLSRPALPAPLEELWQQLTGAGEAVRTDATGALWRLPDLQPQAEPAAPPEGRGADACLPAAEVVARDAEHLTRRRRQAAARSARRRTAAASEEAHRRLQRLAEEEPEAQAGGREELGEPPDRRARLAVGTAVHAMLERFDPHAAPGEELARLRRRLYVELERELERRLEPELHSEARARADELLERLAAGPLLARLRSLAGSILARELPLLLAPAGDGPADPLGPVAGFIDLLYHDPASGQVVVADYKTDEIAGEEAITARATAYASQGAVYIRAVQEALRLSDPPRFELWFLHPGRIVEVPAATPRP